VNSHLRAKREAVAGWTDRSTRSNTRFLYSVDERKLSGDGFALTMTVRDCPNSHAEWHAMRRSFFKRLERMGMLRGHWLTEWQRRGVPHLHAAIWLPETGRSGAFVLHDIQQAWLSVAGEYRALSRGQSIKPIHDNVGWFQYLSKHAVRGLKHYQRSSENMPAGWQTTGRMWGHLGEWPMTEPIRFQTDNPGFWAFRRVIRSWRRADARASGDRRRIESAKSMLRCNERPLSSIRGISEWFPQHLSDLAFLNLATRGFNIRC
jgi:hypothetical protein